jgi:hypothetical protein
VLYIIATLLSPAPLSYTCYLAILHRSLNTFVIVVLDLMMDFTSITPTWPDALMIRQPISTLPEALRLCLAPLTSLVFAGNPFQRYYRIAILVNVRSASWTFDACSLFVANPSISLSASVRTSPFDVCSLFGIDSLVHIPTNLKGMSYALQHPHSINAALKKYFN